MNKNKDPLFQILRVGVGVMVVKDGKVIFGKRKSKHGEGQWSFPGGYLEFGESFEDCAIREVKEECGIEIKNIRFATVTNDIYEKESRHYVTVWMEAEYESGELEILEPDKCEEWRWVNWNWGDQKDLPEPLMSPTYQNMLKLKQNPFKYI